MWFLGALRAFFLQVLGVFIPLCFLFICTVLVTEESALLLLSVMDSSEDYKENQLYLNIAVKALKEKFRNPCV